jgi:hypothetical protein
VILSLTGDQAAANQPDRESCENRLIQRGSLCLRFPTNSGYPTREIRGRISFGDGPSGPETAQIRRGDRDSHCAP